MCVPGDAALMATIVTQYIYSNEFSGVFCERLIRLEVSEGVEGR